MRFTHFRVFVILGSLETLGSLDTLQTLAILSSVDALESFKSFVRVCHGVHYNILEYIHIIYSTNLFVVYIIYHRR